jgi:purine-binding chemotaxis protein CheW
MAQAQMTEKSARPLATQEDAQKDLFLTFGLDKEEYGLEISHVLEIVGRQKITQVPDMPEFVKGVINLRGTIIPVVDVRLRFGMSERQHDERTCLIVVKAHDSATGLLVDRVSDVTEIPQEMIEPSPIKSATVDAYSYVSGFGRVGESVKILLDLESLLAEEGEYRLADESTGINDEFVASEISAAVC